MLLVSCATTSEFLPATGDVAIKVTLSQKDVLNHSLPDSDIGGHGGAVNAAHAALLIAIVIAEAATSGNIDDAEVYAYPEGYKDSHRQKLEWGTNYIYIPNNFSKHGGNIIYEVQGSYKGKWISKYEP